MSHCWMWSKLNCFITGVVNWDMSEKQRKLCLIFYKMFKRIKRVLSHPHPLLSAGVPATPQNSPAVTSND